MRLTFVQTTPFCRRWAQLRLTDDDLRSLEMTLLQYPEAGDVIAGTGGLRKVRFAPPSRHQGKSGALRVGYAYLRVAETVFLLAVFPKNEKANFTAAEKADLRKWVQAIEANLKSG